MSLILEALKKLEREKKAPDRGFLIMAPASWAARSRKWPGAALTLLAVGVAAAAVVHWTARRPVASPPSSEPRAAAVTVPEGAPRNAAPSRAPGPAQPRPGPRSQSPPLAAALPPAATPRPAAPASAHQLQAISRRDGRPVAIVDGRMVYEGDSFDGVRILRIGEAEVEIEVAGERRVLRF